MAIITTTEKKYYKNGTETTSSIIVGHDSDGNRVVRLTFTTDSTTSANSVSWSLNGNYDSEVGLPALRWYIGTDSESHVNAGMTTTEYHGNVTSTNNAGDYTLSGSANVILLPNTTYYLWIFPNTTYYNFYYMVEGRQATVTLSGSAGLIYIDNGTSFDAYQVYIDNGTDWDLYMPYIDDGTDWGLCT